MKPLISKQQFWNASHSSKTFSTKSTQFKTFRIKWAKIIKARNSRPSTKWLESKMYKFLININDVVFHINVSIYKDHALKQESSRIKVHNNA